MYYENHKLNIDYFIELNCYIIYTSLTYSLSNLVSHIIQSMMTPIIHNCNVFMEFNFASFRFAPFTSFFMHRYVIGGKILNLMAEIKKASTHAFYTLTHLITFSSTLFIPLSSTQFHPFISSYPSLSILLLLPRSTPPPTCNNSQSCFWSHGYSVALFLLRLHNQNSYHSSDFS